MKRASSQGAIPTVNQGSWSLGRRKEPPVRKAFFHIAYVVLSAAARVVAAGAPIPWTGSGGGNAFNAVGAAISAMASSGKGPF